MRFTWGQLKWKVNLKLFIKFLKKEMESCSFKNWTQNFSDFTVEFGQWSETFCRAPDANGRGKSEAIVGLRKKWSSDGIILVRFRALSLPCYFLNGRYLGRRMRFGARLTGRRYLLTKVQTESRWPQLWTTGLDAHKFSISIPCSDKNESSVCLTNFKSFDSSWWTLRHLDLTSVDQASPNFTLRDFFTAKPSVRSNWT